MIRIHRRIVIFTIILLILLCFTILIQSERISSKEEKIEELNQEIRVSKLNNSNLNKILDLKQKNIEFIKEQMEIKSNQKNVNYMYGIATAYTPKAGGINADSDPTITSTGVQAKEGVIAVNPNIIPYGSQVMVINRNTVIRGVAEDTGGAMRQNPNQVDILMEDLDKAKEWGRKNCHIIWW